jgi:hypothetical protein
MLDARLLSRRHKRGEALPPNERVQGRGPQRKMRTECTTCLLHGLPAIASLPRVTRPSGGASPPRRRAMGPRSRCRSITRSSESAPKTRSIALKARHSCAGLGLIGWAANHSSTFCVYVSACPGCPSAGRALRRRPARCTHPALRGSPRPVQPQRGLDERKVRLSFQAVRPVVCVVVIERQNAPCAHGNSCWIAPQPTAGSRRRLTCFPSVSPAALAAAAAPA